MIFYIFLVLILLLIIYLLVIPIRVYIDTLTNQYFIQFGGIAKANVLYDETEFLKLKLRVIGYDHYVFPLQWQSKINRKKRFNKTPKKSSFKSLPIQKIWRVVKSFEVKQFLLDIDTGDCISNSKLYPVFACCNFYFGSRMLVNYQSRNRLLLSIENRPIRMIKAYMNI